MLGEIERESREWRIRCETCGRERSLWSVGGRRWKAWGTSYTVGRCSNCSGLRRLKVYKPAAAPSSTQAERKAAPR